jgi:hypothetical protein
VASNGTQDHHGSHRNLLWSGDRIQPKPIDAIIVPTVRTPAYLAPAADLAESLGCALLTLHSRQWTSADKAAQRLPRSVDLIAIDVPDASQLRLPRWCTSQMLTGDFARLRPLSDLSTKRNLGLVVSRLLGWSRVMFLDDDITALNPEDVRRASGLLDTHNAVGLHVCGFHDHSVVCHAYRDAGGGQQSFIGGGALVTQVRRTRSFFPEIYNDDWFFVLDGDKGLQPVAVTGRVDQYPYDPFRTPDRARAEEFGDVLAEGIYWLLDQGLSIDDADQAHWTAFLAKRRQFIERVLRMVAADGTLDPAERVRRTDALRGSLGRLARIKPDLCVQYLQAWKSDQKAWRRHIDKLPAGLEREPALAMLTRGGAQLEYRLGGRGVRQPAATAAEAPRTARPVPAGPAPPAGGQDRRELVPAGAEASCSIGQSAR